MNVTFSDEELGLLTLLKEALRNESPKNVENREYTGSATFLNMAKKHAVLPLLYDVIQKKLFPEHSQYVEQVCKQTVLQSYRLLFLTKYVVGVLNAHGINAVVLKGAATASLYPVPELRKSGDVDLLIPATVDGSKLNDIMTGAGFGISEEQHANHHVVFVSKEGISIEIHVMLSEPFAYKRVNQAMEIQAKECWEHIHMANVMGIELPLLDKPYHAYELLLHMLQHFMYAGFGLKLLCDWVMIWRQEWSEEEYRLFAMLVKECGLEKFAEALTSVCVKHLGLEKTAFAWSVSSNDVADEMLREILDAEDFGNADVNRMVMMSGTGVAAYIKEFQHQMHLNFPKAGRCFALWPVLWVMTLIRFLRNNKKVRNTSAKEVLKEAKRRSELMKQMKLFH